MTTTAVSMEGMVRPFLSGDVTPKSTRLAEKPRNPLVVECSLGGSGGRTTTFSMSGSGFIVTNADEKYKESNRKSTLVKVENEDDPNQFVEFCRADKVNLSRRNTGSTPPKPQSTYTGGVEGTTYAANSAKSREYSFQYPEDKTCKSKTPDKGGNCD